jgi:hypothetical protein
MSTGPVGDDRRVAKEEQPILGEVLLPFLDPGPHVGKGLAVVDFTEIDAFDRPSHEPSVRRDFRCMPTESLWS